MVPREPYKAALGWFERKGMLPGVSEVLFFAFLVVGDGGTPTEPSGISNMG